jgi:hypothetical protein
MMIISRLVSFRTLLVLGAIASAALALLLSSAASRTAYATNQSYNCESNYGKSTCNYVHGSDNYVKNAESIDYSAKGNTCGQITNDGKNEALCAAYPAYFFYVCLTSEVYGHGYAETKNGANQNIAGHEDNFASCS